MVKMKGQLPKLHKGQVAGVVHEDSVVLQCQTLLNQRYQCFHNPVPEAGHVAGHGLPM